jgi:hypothetical protein
MAITWNKWIVAAVTLAFVTGGVTWTSLYGTPFSESSAKTVLKYSCRYWDSKGLDICQDTEFMKQIEIIKTQPYTYYIKTNNNFCLDLVFTGLGGKKANTMFAHDRSDDFLRSLTIVSEYNILNKGLCK